MNDFNANPEGKMNTCDNHSESKQTSELRRYVSFNKFETAFKAFLKQADVNAVTKKANGGKTPVGFETKREFDGANFSTHFGQGAASKAPYINWWVLSIYYIIESQSIVMGIEKSRYPHLSKMEPSGFKKVPGKEDVAVFYRTVKDNIDYEKLYERFISIAEEIMSLGLK